MKKIFISHSTKDKIFVEYLTDLLESMGVPAAKIFCTSLEGYGVPLGDNFLERIKEELNEEVLVLFVMSENFYNSPACLCEMGAAWIKSRTHIPILIPPFDFCDIKGMVLHTQGLKINDKSKLNLLCSTVRELFHINGFDFNIWERKRDNFLNKVDKEINNKIKRASAVKNNVDLQISFEYSPDNIKEFDIIIKDAIEKLNKLPWIVRKGLYYHFAEKDFTIEPSVDIDESYYAQKAAEDDYLKIDGKWVTLNAGDPKVRKAIEALNKLKCFLQNVDKDFHRDFEQKYEICAKIESRKFWRMMELI